MSKAADKIDAAVAGNTGGISAAFVTLCEAGSRLKTVTRFVSKDLRVRITRRRGCPSEFSVSVGKPNYREREYLKRYIGGMRTRGAAAVLAPVIPRVIYGLTMTTAAPTARKRSRR